MVGPNRDAGVDGIIELSSDDLIEVADRASLLSAASNAQNIARLTGTHGVVALPLVRAQARLPRPSDVSPGAPDGDDPELGRLRALVDARTTDPIGTLRARLELALAELERGDAEAALADARAAAEACPHAPAAHALLRRLRLGRENIDEQLAHVGELVADASADRTRADWLGERARLLEAKGGVSEESVAAWTEAAALAPEHAGVLYGLEVALDTTGRHAELAELLGGLAELSKDCVQQRAWLHVERAHLLDRRLADVAGARSALGRALELEPGLGPVRDACVDHAVRHRDDARLGELLEAEAGLETDRGRAARLELDAALAYRRAGVERARVVRVLERAHGRAPTSALVDGRVAEELAREYDADGRDADALRARKAALKSLVDPREEVVALRAIATSAQRAGDVDAAVLALERARVLEPEDPTLLAEIDRIFVAAARHEARAVLWMREAARVEDASKKAHALLASAASSQAAGRTGEAAKLREAAWLTAPAAPGVYDALAERLAPASPALATQRVALYEQALRMTKDPEQRLHYLEKIAWLHDDVAGDTAAAVRVYEEILQLAPSRRSAIIGLTSAATRAADDRALARALLAHAGVAGDPAARADLRLRAAEALGSHDPERALALAESLRDEASLEGRAAEVVTRLHLAAERWDRAATSLADRAASAEGTKAIELVLAESTLLLERLRSPERALAALARVPASLAGDPAIRAATLAALAVLGDEQRLRDELVALAERASSPGARAGLLLRAAEIDERNGRDAEALARYEQALAASPNEALVAERVRRLGARTKLADASAALVPPLATAVRAMETDAAGSAEPLLATGARDLPTLRTAERLARRAGSAPQLANALAMTAEAEPRGMVAQRALEGLASLFTWTLRPSDDTDPWERLLALGTCDLAGVDVLVQRARPRVHEGDAAAARASIAALSARLDRAVDETDRLVVLLQLARLHHRVGAHREAAVACRAALDADPSSLTAACLLAEIAAQLDDAGAAVLASRALAAIVVDRRAKAEHLRDAADLTSARGDRGGAAALLEEALRANPEDVQIAARLAELQRSRGAAADLARALREALEAARSAEAIVPIASELADLARNQLRDPMLAIASLERLREVAPAHVPALFHLAELFIGQRAWDKALVALAETVRATTESSDKLVALAGRASIYARVLGQPALAEAELRTALEIDPHDPRAIRAMLDLGVALSNEERATLLGRLVIGETAPAERLKALLELADARRAVGDANGAEGALVEAASLSPDLAMLERVRAAVGPDGQALARILSRAVARAHESGKPIDPSWLVGLGQIELDLGRFDEAIDRFEEALRGDATRDDARVALARALAARGRHALAADALSSVILGPSRRLSIDTGLMRLYETSLSGAGRRTEQWVARELRAVAGDLAPNEYAELEARLSNLGHAEGLSCEALRRAVMPKDLGRHPIWDVAALASGLAGKLAKVSLADQGAHSRDRVKPRTNHPIRAVFDRVIKAFELAEVELAVSHHATEPSIACEDAIWVIAPASFESCPEVHAVASLARSIVRIALGVPWLGPIDVPEVLALLVGFARQVAPGFTAQPQHRVEPYVDSYEQKARRAIDRKRRRALEDLAPMLEHAPPITEDAFREAIAATEARAAFLLSGSLRASLFAALPSDPSLVEALRVPGPPSLAAVFDRPASRDLASFALRDDTTALRRSIGTA